MAKTLDGQYRLARWIYNLPAAYMGIFKKIINFLESPNTLLTNCIFTFIGCLLLRNFLEGLVTSNVGLLTQDSLALWKTIAHFDASFLVTALAFTLVLHYITKTPVISILKVVLPSFVLLIIPPIVDFCVHWNQIVGYVYFDPAQNVSLMYSYLTYGGGYGDYILGRRLEVTLVLIGIFSYCYYKTNSYWKGLIGALLAYSIVFLYGSSHFVIQGITKMLVINYQISGSDFLRYFLILNFLLGTWVCYLADKKVFISILSEIPFLRILNYVLMFLLGISMALQFNLFGLLFLETSNNGFLGDMVLILVAIFFAALFAMTNNNLADIEVDRISNAHRAVASGRVSEVLYARLSYIFLALAFIYAAPTGAQSIFLIALTAAIYYIYSSFPFRLKRILIISKFVIALNSLLLIMLGYWLVMRRFPSLMSMEYALIFVIFALAANFIDLKDVKGDKAAGIKTLPVVLGMRQAQFFCGIAFFISYLLVAYILPQHQLDAFIAIVGALQFYLLTRKNYNEKPVLIIYLASILCLIVFEFGAQYYAMMSPTWQPSAVMPQSQQLDYPLMEAPSVQ